MKPDFLFACAAFFLAFSATAQIPVIQYTSPGAISLKKSTDVIFVGENLGGATELWTSFASETVLKSNDATRAVFELALPKEAQPGIGAVRLATTNGVSSWRLILIDDLPTVAENESNKTMSAAQPLRLPVAVDGVCDELSFDFYTFEAKKGQRVSVEVVAQRMGSALDPVIRLLDPKGRELAYCDDDPSAGRDARIQFKAPASGHFLIEVRDINYQGGPQHRYRLRLGDFPLASCAFPLAAPIRTKTKFNVLSSSGEDLKSVTLDLAGAWRRISVGTRYSSGHGSGFVSIFSSELPGILETEPNDATNSCNILTLPIAINGRLDKDKDRDLFQFEAQNDQRLIFHAQTRSLGSPCDVFMELQKADGAKVTQANVTGADEGSITNTFKEAGLYRLLVEELNRRGAPNLAYRVEIKPFEPGFDLSVEQEKVHGTNGGDIEIKVAAARYDYNGPIHLSLDGIQNIALENAVVDEKKTNTTLKLKIPPELELNHLVHFKIIGRADVGGREVMATASTLPALHALFPGLMYPPAELDGLIGLGILPPGSKPPQDKPRRRRN
jgi:hypothetical protein